MVISGFGTRIIILMIRKTSVSEKESGTSEAKECVYRPKRNPEVISWLVESAAMVAELSSSAQCSKFH